VRAVGHGDALSPRRLRKVSEGKVVVSAAPLVRAIPRDAWSPQHWAAFYQVNGFSVVPLLPKSKEPQAYEGWQDREFTPDYFPDDSNVGIKNFVRSDPDCPEAEKAADAFLPPTGAVWGRGERRRIKRMYRCATLTKNLAWKDVDGTMLLELRGNGQDMVPPSVHPDGERLTWDGPLNGPEEYPEDVLVDAHRHLATAALSARHWPKSGRHDLRLALARVLLETLGLDDATATAILASVCRLVGSDARGVAAVEPAVRDTRARLLKKEPATGAKTVLELLPEQGGQIIARLCDWYGVREFRRDKNKIVATDNENIRLALDKLGVSLAEDKFADRKLVTRDGKTQPLADDALNRIWIEIADRFHFAPPIANLERVLMDEAARRPFHPVCDYLDSLKWDGVPRIDRWLVEYGGAADTEYTRTVGALVLVAAVRRVRQPGCKFDEMLVIESFQGKGKSNALRALCPRGEWFTDNVPLNLDAKRMIEETAGIWIAEVGELAGFSSARIEHLKATLSRAVDGPTRMAYARLPMSRERQFVVIGTTNAKAYLNDSTGGRRFWPVSVTKFDWAGVANDRDQIWAEAAAREADGASIRLAEHLWSVAANEQEKRREADPWEDVLEAKYGDAPPGARVALEEPWRVLGFTSEKERGPKDGSRVTRIMHRLGYEKKNRRDPNEIVNGKGKQKKQWVSRERDVTDVGGGGDE
jgi:hypothetical protein